MSVLRTVLALFAIAIVFFVAGAGIALVVTPASRLAVEHSYWVILMTPISALLSLGIIYSATRLVDHLKEYIYR